MLRKPGRWLKTKKCCVLHASMVQIHKAENHHLTKALRSYISPVNSLAYSEGSFPNSCLKYLLKYLGLLKPTS